MNKVLLGLVVLLSVVGIMIVTYPVGEHYGPLFQEHYIESMTYDHIPVSITLEPSRTVSWKVHIPESGRYDHYRIWVSGISSTDAMELKIYALIDGGKLSVFQSTGDRIISPEIMIYSENVDYYFVIENVSSLSRTISIHGDIYILHKITKFQKGTFWLVVGFSLAILGAIGILAGYIRS